MTRTEFIMDYLSPARNRGGHSGWWESVEREIAALETDLMQHASENQRLRAYAELLVGLLNGARAFVDDEAYAAKIDAALSSHYLQGASIRKDEGDAHDAVQPHKTGDVSGLGMRRVISAGVTTRKPDHFVHETGKESGLQKYERTLAERLRPQSCTQQTFDEWWGASLLYHSQVAEDVQPPKEWMREAWNAALASARHQVNREPGAWLIFFDDAEVKPEVFTGEGAAAAAKARFASISDNWNAHLFALVESNTRDAAEANRSQSVACTKQEAPAEFAAFVRFNGERQRWTDPVITYAQAVANCTRGLGRPEDIYTVSFSTPNGRDGTLRPGQETRVEEGMIIDAGRTDRA